MNITWLGENACSNIEISGGKAANLSLLAEQFPVPSGFCVTTGAFSEAISDGLKFDQATLPKQLMDEIANAYQQLEKQCKSQPLRVAVRSSAADEDGALASFAGQHDTFLNVVGIDSVYEAVVKCWASAFTDQAIAYRQAQGYEVDQVHIGVLIQEMVPADMSFVMFSVNPLTQIANEMMINVSWGLGESVVSGEVTPDVFVIEKSTGQLLNETVSVKQQMTIQSDDGTKLVPVPRLLQQRPSLNADQIKKVFELAKSLEQQMGWPVDIEGAFHQDELYLLQCRPITTLNQKG